jgi:hypothetical protein
LSLGRVWSVLAERLSSRLLGAGAGRSGWVVTERSALAVAAVLLSTSEPKLSASDGWSSRDDFERVF